MGRPVLGPARCTLQTTQGVSVQSPRPIFSIMSEKPGPDVLVMAFMPPQLAPRIAAIEASSSSIWMKTPPTSGNRSDIRSATSVAGVIG